MLEVLHRSQGGRLCEYRRGDFLLEAPSVLAYNRGGSSPEEGTVGVDETARWYRICGATLRHDPLILGTKSSREKGLIHEFTELREAALLRLPLPQNLDVLKDKDILIIENAYELRSDPRKAVETILRLRSELGFRPIIYVPGFADPSNLALLTYMGLDLFDDTYPVIRSWDAVRCSDSGELLSYFDSDLGQDAEESNRQEMAKELSLVRHYIRKGRLRELVDVRVPSSPWSVAALRLHDRLGYGIMEARCAVSGDRMACNTTQSLQRPEIARFRQKVLNSYKPPEHKRVLVLLPCSAKKPYSLSKSHKMFTSAIRTGDHETLVHEVVVTSPLGIVPRELETFFPANAYDIPVTGEWKCEEKIFIRNMLESLLSYGYDRVVKHLGDGYEFLDDLTETIDTVVGDPTSPASLQLLERTLREVTQDMPRESYQTDRMNTLRGIMRFQFGDAAETILSGAYVTGKYPFWKIMADKVQLGMLTGERGMVSLTLDGAERLMRIGLMTVHIEDFSLKGNLFAVGVTDADPGIRIGDDVAICHDGELRGVGVALMPGPDMQFLKRGIAVKVRHKTK
ncbi:MAG: DUF5591 domain-containing protein [Candidatus Methanomethylophilaceae archaeon]